MESVARSLFDLGMPWWEFVLRAVAVYVVVLLMVRLSGKRTVGQFTPFDLLVVVLLGTAVQNSLIGEDTSLLGGLILAATLLGLNWSVGKLSSRSRRFDEMVEGKPVILVRHGHLFRDDNEVYPVAGERYAIPASGSLMRFRRTADGVVDALVTDSPWAPGERIKLRLPDRQ